MAIYLIILNSSLENKILATLTYPIIPICISNTTKPIIKLKQIQPPNNQITSINISNLIKPIIRLKQIQSSNISNPLPNSKPTGNFLKDRFPQLFNEIHPTLNTGTDLNSIKWNSDIELTWLCSKTTCGHHIWKRKVKSRTDGNKVRQCPFCIHWKNHVCECDSFGKKHDNLSIEFDLAKKSDPSLNLDIDPFATSCRSSVICSWKCQKHLTCDKHIWQTAISHRVGSSNQNGSECPFCNGSSTNKCCPCDSFGQKHPILLKEFQNAQLFNPDYNKNIDPFTIRPGSGTICMWKCANAMCNHHIWPATMDNRTKPIRPTGCPFCNNGLYKQTCVCDSFGTLYPNLLKEFVYEDNNTLNPFAIPCGSKIECIWKCQKCDCKWPARVSSRTRKQPTSCPKCRQSQLEKAMITILNELNLKYIPGKRFPDCVNINTLPFDFYVPDKNILIELDGLQHFKIVRYDGITPTDLIGCQSRDRIKNIYSKTKSIHLIRISHSEFDDMKTHFISFLKDAEKSNDRIEKFYGEEYIEPEYIQKVLY